MSDDRDTLERELDRLSPPRIPFDRLARRRDRKRRGQRIRAGVVGIAIAVAVGWLGADAIRSASPDPVDPPPTLTPAELGIFADVRGWIAYGDGSGIWAMDPFNSAGDQVLLSSIDAVPIAWSNDGSKLLILQLRPAGGGSSAMSLLVLNADGTETHLVDGDQISGGSFTPDGRKVVYASLTESTPDVEWQSGIYIVDADGGSPQLLSTASHQPTTDYFQRGMGAATSSPDGARIAYFEGMQYWGSELWVMNADGTDRRQIIGEEERIAGVEGLQWSPDGTRLAFKASGRIYVVNADGSELSMVARGIGDRWPYPDPYWSPDGSFLAYTKGGSLATVGLDGGQPLELGAGRSGPWNPLDRRDVSATSSVSRRDGEFIVLERLGTGHGWDLAAQDPQTGQIRKIVETDGVVDCDPAGCRTFIKEADWSADGRWVAFRVTHRSLDGPPLGPCGPTVGVWVATADGDPRQLTTPCDAPPSSDVAIEEMWAWSPVDDLLAYVRIDGETDELFVIDPSDGTRTWLGTGDVAPGYVAGWGRLASSLAWSPDGSQIAYADGTSVYAVDVEGGERSLLADSLDIRITDIAWSPDGTRLLVSHLDHDLVRWTLIMNADGSDLRVLAEGPEKPRWSPVGDGIVVQTYNNVTSLDTYVEDTSKGPDDAQVWTVSPDGSDQIKVFDSDGCEMRDDPEPVWAPDGPRIAYIGCGGETMVANADGTGTPKPIDYLVWRSWYSSGLTGWDLWGIGQ